jgi:hypothetical protein
MATFGRALAALAVAAVALHGAARAEIVDAGLRVGIQRVQEGDLEAAVVTLEAALPGLQGDPALDRDRIQAHLYLGMAHLGLEHVEAAREHLGQAWTLSAGERLDPKVFPPRVIAMYEQNRPGSDRARATDTPGERRIPKPAVTFGLGAAAGIVAAKVTESGEKAESAPPITVDLRTLRLFNCDDSCRAWINGQLLAEVGLGQDSGRLDLTNRLKIGANTIEFELENGHGGVAYGFEVRVGEAIVFQQVCGVVGRLGCEDDRTFPPGVVKRYEYVLLGK